MRLNLIGMELPQEHPENTREVRSSPHQVQETPNRAFQLAIGVGTMIHLCKVWPLECCREHPRRTERGQDHEQHGAFPAELLSRSRQPRK